MKIWINNNEINATEGDTILMAASKAGIRIPTLCHLKGEAKGGICGICEVEADGRNVRACICKVSDGMNILTDTDTVKNNRIERLRKLAKGHRFDCETCKRCMDCEFIRILNENGIYDFEYQRRSNDCEPVKLKGDIVFDDSKCIGCRRCVSVCKDGSVSMVKDEDRFRASTDAEKFTGSGECVAACPVAAFYIDEKEQIRQIRRAIHDKKCHAIVTPDAAAVFGELLFDSAGGDFAGKMAAILRKIGFEKVYMAGRNASVRDISDAVRKDDQIVTVSVSTVTGPERPGADIDITIHTLLTIFRRACVSRTTMVRVWRGAAPEPFDDAGVSKGEYTFEFGGAMPHRDCYIRNMNDLPGLRREALNQILNG